MKHGNLGAALVVVLALGTMTGCSRHDANDDAAGGASGAAVTVDVTVSHVERRLLAEHVQAPGQWRAANELEINAPFAALVESLSVHPGDRVQPGQVLGLLATRESRAALRGAELMLRQAGDAGARAEAQRAVNMAREDLVRVPLIASAAGVVVRRSVEPGAEVAEGGELLKLVAERDVVFEAHVPLANAATLRVGQDVMIHMEGAPEVAARVDRRLPSTSAEDQTVLLWLTPARTASPEWLDRFGSAAIATGAPRRVLAVPDSALVSDDLTGALRVARVGADSIAVWQGITAGIAANGWHELVHSTLQEGDAVVTRGQHGLPDSTRVRVAR